MGDNWIRWFGKADRSGDQARLVFRLDPELVLTFEASDVDFTPKGEILLRVGAHAVAVNVPPRLEAPRPKTHPPLSPAVRMLRKSRPDRPGLDRLLGFLVRRDSMCIEGAEIDCATGTVLGKCEGYWTCPSDKE